MCHHSYQFVSVRVSPWLPIPYSSVHSEFLVEVKQENIARDAESAGNLFSVLQTVGHSASKTILVEIAAVLYTHMYISLQVSALKYSRHF